VETLLKFILNNWKTSVISMEKSDNVHSSWKLWNFYGNSFHILNDNFGHFEMETCFVCPASSMEACCDVLGSNRGISKQFS
jgi:regulator of replication initiation timing